MPGRHRDAVDLRADGLAVVLGPLLRRPGVRAVLLIDVGSGMLLDGAGDPAVDLEDLGARHAEVLRTALGPAERGEVVLTDGTGVHHVVRGVPDPEGGGLAVSVLLTGQEWAVWRARRTLRRVSDAALTPGLPRAPRWRPGRGGMVPLGPVRGPLAGAARVAPRAAARREAPAEPAAQVPASESLFAAAVPPAGPAGSPWLEGGAPWPVGAAVGTPQVGPDRGSGEVRADGAAPGGGGPAMTLLAPNRPPPLPPGPDLWVLPSPRPRPPLVGLPGGAGASARPDRGPFPPAALPPARPEESDGR